MCIISCKKEDTLAPDITIIKPNTSAAFSYLDYIHITGMITDDKEIRTAVFEIWDQALDQRYQMKSVSVYENEFEMDVYLHLDNVHLSSGNYYLKVTAGDGFNSESEYVQIYIHGALKSFKEVLYITNVAGQFDIYGYDGNNSTFLKTIGTEFLGMEINSWDQQVIISGTDQESLRGLDRVDMLPVWQLLPANNGADDWFVSLDFFKNERMVFSGLADGTKKIINAGGTTESIANAYGLNYISAYSLLQEDKLFVVEKSVTGNYVLAQYNANSGVFMYDMPLNSSTEYMFMGNNGNLYLLNYDGSVLYADWYIPVSGTKVNAGSLVTSGVNDIERVGTGQVVMATEEGIYLYKDATQDFTLIHANVFLALTYDEVNQHIYAINNNMLMQMSLSGTVLNTEAVNGGIDLSVMYNK